jgi:hypothetical protein
LLPAEALPHRECPCDVRGVAPVLGTGIDQEQISIGQLLIVFGVVQDGAVHSAGDDVRIAKTAGPATAKDKVEHRLDLVLPHPGCGVAHRHVVRFSGDLAGPAQQGEFSVFLAESLLGEIGPGVADLDRTRAAPGPPGPELRHGLEQTAVEVGVRPQAVVKNVDTLQGLGECLIQLLDRVGLIDAILTKRALDPRPASVPGLLLGIPRADEELVSRRSGLGQEQGDRIRFAETGQVVEITVLPEDVVRVVGADRLAGGGDDGRRAAEELAEAPPPLGQDRVHRWLGFYFAVTHRGLRRHGVLARPE